MIDTVVNTKLRAARERLGVAQEQLDAAIASGPWAEASSGALGVAAGSLRAARLDVDELSRQIEADIVPAPEMHDCPSCGKSGRVGATICGYCWKKL